MFENIKFVKTDDGSVGLYSNSVNDIFHSKTGALKESYDKFILPILETKIKCKKILDICYGIGYNTKSALKNINNDLEIDALEYDSTFIKLSPFVNDAINDYDLKLFILSQMSHSLFDLDEIKEFIEELYSFEYNEFLSTFASNLISLFNNGWYKSLGLPQNNSFLHNIYYSYISNKTINDIEPNKYLNSKINFFLGDARETIKQTNNIYDAVFLDAFSSQKDPTLWTIDFLSLVKSKIHTNSLLLSYSKATPYRSALLELGFYVGKIFIDNIDMGTIASLNESLINNELTQYDYDLISTRSGITFKDPLLNLSADKILLNRKKEADLSNRISHTKFLKAHLKE